MEALTLKLFGQTQVVLNGRDVSFRTKKDQALFIYLVAEADAQRRSQLLELLWPGMPERSARQNLRQIIFTLRKTLPEQVAAQNGSGDTAVILLQTNRQTIQLNPLADIGVDISQFTDFLRNGQVHNHVDLLTCHQCRHHLEQAVALYSADFLADFYLEDSREFEEWAEAQRHSYRRKALDALETLTTIYTRQKNYPQAQQYAERQLEIDDLRESAYRQLLEILALAGQREEALATYERCRHLLAEELGMAPTKRTTEIYNKIVAGDLRFDAPETQGVRGYELKEEIGEGAYGTIYRAIQPVINRDVAVKVIRRKYANDPEFIRRFEAEAQTIARLEHPYIVPLHDYWRDPEGAYLVMRLFRGGNLLDCLAQGPWDGEQTLKMVEQISSALAAAHRQGIVHRDIKPANILFDETGNAYLSDFGIAKDTRHDGQLTAEAQLIGTPDYISPEQLRNEAVSGQSDLYSLGAVLYETLTGERPFADSPFALRIQKHLQEPLPLISASRPGLPHQIDEVVQKATAKRPSDRYVDALALAEAFRQAVRGNGTAVTLTPTAVPADVEIINPYKGLRAFQESDASDFYGRETLTQQIVSRLEESRFLAVVGPSGSGKSSLVKAGLIPALRQEAIPDSDKWFVAEMVPGSHPLEELELALLPIAVNPPPSLVEPMQKDTRGLLRTIRRILPDEEDATLLLLIDQFEELFTLVEDDGRRQHFLNSLLEALTAPRSPLRIVVTLRADFYDRPLQIQPLAQLVKENTEIILPLTQEELTWAIQEPARQMGVRLEPSVVTAMVADVAEQPGALPLLQYALTELFEERQDNVMTLAAYEALGGVSGALALRAEELYASFEPAGQEATRQLFLRLVTLGEGVEDTRRRVRQSELEGLSVNGAQDSDNRLPFTDNRLPLTEYGRYRLLTFDHDPSSREPTVEVAHEALLREWPRLRRWLAESRDDVRLQRLLAVAAAEWLQADRDNGFLLRGSRLDLFSEWAKNNSLALTQTEQDFLTVSLTAREERVAAERKRQEEKIETERRLAQEQAKRADEQTRAASRLRRLAIGLAVVLILAIGAAWLAVASRQDAIDSEATAVAAANQQATAEADALDNANLALTREAEAVAAQAEAEERRLEAEDAQETAVAEGIRADEERDIALVAESETDNQRIIAEHERDLTRSRELALAAVNRLDDNPELSILLALEALNTVHTNEAEDALHQAIQASHVRQTFVGHAENEMGQLAFTPDGTRLVSTSLDGTVRVWDVATGAELLSLENHGGAVHTVAIDPQGEWAVTGGEDGNARLWDLNSGEEIRLFPDFYVSEPWGQLDLSSDGSLLATPSLSNTVKIWDTATGELLRIFTAPLPVEFVEFSPDDQMLLVGIYGSRSLSVWQLDSGEEVLQIPDSATGWEFGFSPDGTLIQTTNEDVDAIVFWDLEASLSSGTPVEKSRIDIPYNFPTGAFSPDSQHFIVENTVYDVNSGEVVQTLPTDFLHSWPVYSPDGNSIAYGVNSGQLKISELSPLGYPELAFLDAHEGGVFRMDTNLEESLLATADFYNGVAHLWDIETGERLVSEVAHHDDGIATVAISADGSKLATGSLGTPEIKVWDASGGEALVTLEHGPPSTDWPFRLGIVHVDFNPVDGRYLASAGADGTARIWEWETGELVHLFEPHPKKYAVLLAEFSPDGAHLAAVTNSPLALIKIWDVESGEELLTIPDLPDRAWNLRFSPDGRFLAAGGAAGWLRLWDATTGEEVVQLTGHPGTIFGIVFTSDSKRLITGGGNQVRIWDTATGAELSRLNLTYPVINVQVLADDSGLVTSTSAGGGVRFYTLDVNELMEIAESRITRPFTPAECAQYRIESCPGQ